MTNSEWHQFLKFQSAHFGDDDVLDYGDPQAELEAEAESRWLTDLSHFSLIQIKGNQASAFLQGQLTCDISKLREHKASLSACCNPKGRMIANFYIWRDQDDYYVLLPRSMASYTYEHLKKYAVFSKVELNTINETVIIEVSGELNSTVFSPIKLPNSHHLIIANAEKIIETWSQLSESKPLIGSLAWRAFNIKHGLVFIYPRTRELFTPQMINLQKLDGVSFTKGCYVGQEIIARTEHLGKLKRHLYHAHVDGGSQPVPGDELHNKNDQVIGIVVESTISKNNGFECLAVLQDQLFQKDGHAFHQNTELESCQLI